MKNFIYLFTCAAITLFFNVQAVYAAFPVHAEAERSVSVKTEKRSFEEFINATIEKYNLPVPPIRDAAGGEGGSLSIISFVLGLGGLTALIASGFVAAAGGILLAAALGLGIAAIVTGAKGAKRTPLRGFGIAGLVLGIIDLSIILIALIFVVLILALYLK